MPITHRHLGRHGVRVSNLCLGTMNFGWHTAEKDAFRIMDRALELGINFFDTADVYGWGGEPGSTEEIIGRWLAQGGGRREAIVLATKVYGTMKRRDVRPEPNSHASGLSAYKIRKHLDASLARLQTDHVDLYQVHHVDRDCPWDEIWQAFDVASSQGKITYAGFLGGALEKHDGGRRTADDFAARVESKRAQLQRWEDLCRRLGNPPGEVALAWLLHNPVVTAPIVGPRTVEQLESAVRAAAIELDRETLNELDQIFPGPGGEAPGAYAW